jgi:hypothetical protein
MNQSKKKHAWPTEVTSVYHPGDYSPRKILGLHILKVRKLPDGQRGAIEALLESHRMEADPTLLPFTLDRMNHKIDAAIHQHARKRHGE